MFLTPFFSLCVGLLAFVPNLAVASKPAESVIVTARTEWVSPTLADLVVEVTIADGHHIYAMTQPKPLLATRISIVKSPNIVSKNEFTTSTMPTVSQHPQLNVKMYELTGTIQWRTRVEFKEGEPNRNISGELFAQACLEDRCFAFVRSIGQCAVRRSWEEREPKLHPRRTVYV